MSMMINKSKKPIIKLEDGWNQISEVGLERFIERVEQCNNMDMVKRPNPASELTEISDLVFIMATQRAPDDCSEGLYDKTEERLTLYFQTSFLEALRNARNVSHLAFCDEFAVRWRQAMYAVAGFRRMFDRLNKYYVPNNDKLDLEENGYNVFKQVVYETLAGELRESILHFFREDRDGSIIDRSLVKDCVNIFIRLGQSLPTEAKSNNGDGLFLYKQHLEAPLLAATSTYYEVESQKWLVQMSIPEFLAKVEQIFGGEMQRVDSMLHPDTSTTTITDVLQRSLLTAHQARVIEDVKSGLNVMLEEKSDEDLARLYRLYRNVDNGIQPIATEYKTHICSLGYAAIQKAQESETTEAKKNSQNKLTLISKIIELHERFHNHCVRDFDNNDMLSKALRDAFEEFINKTNYVTRYLAKYTHQFMMKGGPSEGMTTVQKTDQMKQIQMIYGYIRDKDVFEREYQLFLSHRLLSNSSSSDRMEQEMIGYLKAECGYFWAQKLEDMFKDIQTSKDVMKAFKADLAKKNKPLNFDFDMNICEYGKWPEQIDRKKMKAILPPQELHQIYQSMEGFYTQKHPGRLFFVRWDRGGGECYVTFNRKKKIAKQLIFKSTYQIMIMLCFNRRNSQGKNVWKFAELRNMLGISTKELEQAVLPLIHPKLAVLQKRPSGRSFGDDHMFRLNGGCKVTNKRIVIPQPMKVASSKKVDEVPPEIQKQRKHQIEAAIVRIMKARRSLQALELQGEVVQQLQARFTPDLRQIKKYIEGLIAQEYLERDDEERTLLIYKS